MSHAESITSLSWRISWGMHGSHGAIATAILWLGVSCSRSATVAGDESTVISMDLALCTVIQVTTRMREAMAVCTSGRDVVIVWSWSAKMASLKNAMHA